MKGISYIPFSQKVLFKFHVPIILSILTYTLKQEGLSTVTMHFHPTISAWDTFHKTTQSRPRREFAKKGILPATIYANIIYHNVIEKTAT